MRSTRLGSTSPIVVAAVLSAGTSLTSAAWAGSSTEFSPVEVLATPGASCTLSGDGIGTPLKLSANNLGVVRFAALRADSTNAIRSLSLNCTDASSNRTTHPVDLTSGDTFKPLSTVPVPSTVHVRPALAGDPMTYSWEQLLHMGYGNRPDPSRAPLDYAKWL
jgi:hypothetical protein